MEEAQLWTLIGLLAATILGVLLYLGNRIDALASETRSGFARVDSRMDGVSARIDSLSVRVEEQGAHLADRIYELVVKLDDHLRWHAN